MHHQKFLINILPVHVRYAVVFLTYRRITTNKSVIPVVSPLFQVETKEQRLRFADTSSLGSYANKEVISTGTIVDLKRHGYRLR